MSRDAEIVVTGLSVVSAAGWSAADFWADAVAGVVQTRTLTRFDTSVLASDRGAEICAEPDPGAARGDRGAPLAVEWAARAARDAAMDARLLGAVASERAGVCFGTVMATRGEVDRWVLGAGGRPGDRSAAGGLIGPSSLSRVPAARLGFGGPNCVIATACAAGNSAIAYGVDALRGDRADAMVVGGAEEISQTLLLVFDSFRALAPDCVRPFDRARRGLLLGEGAAALVLEREADAKARGAAIHGRVLGSANVGDAHHMTAPHPEGHGAARSIRRALAQAGVAPGDVDHVSAHGTGTPANDLSEAAALRQVLGSHADSVPVTALKSMLGHTQGAASAIQAVGCLLTMRDGVVPPVANFETPDPRCPLDVVAGAARATAVKVAVSNAFGFGGNIECVVLGAR